MGSLYRIDREWSDRFIPAIKTIVGPQLIEIAPEDADLHEATDLIVFRARDAMIAARIRRRGFSSRWPFDVTFRLSRGSGRTTEFEKIRRRWGDLFFYGHEADESMVPAIDLWWLIDLHELRYAFQDEECRKAIRWEKRQNNDAERTSFIAFDLRSFPRHKVKIVRAGSRSLDYAPSVNLTPIERPAPPAWEPFGDLFPETLDGMP